MAEVERLNRDILLKEIELERYAINFRKKNNVQGRWRGWRYFLSQEANVASTAGGLTFQAVERARIIKTPNDLLFVKGKFDHVPRFPIRAKLEAGLYPQLSAQCIGATGSALELAINMFHEHQARKQGYAPKAGIARVLAIKSELNDLFAARKKAVIEAGLNGEELIAANEEEKVLRDLTDMGLREYCDFHYTARRFQGFQDSLYCFDIAKNMTGVAGNIIALYAFHRRKPHYAGPSGVLVFISGFLLSVGPIASRGIGKWVGYRQNKQLSAILTGTERKTIECLEKDTSVLNALLAKKEVLGERCSAQTAAMLSGYERQSHLKKSQLTLATREIRNGTRAATENVTSATIVGGTKMSLGITGMIAGYKFARFNHKANSILQAGTLSYMIGSYYGVGENIRLRVVDEMNRRRLGKIRQLPMQVLGDRLKALDDMEVSLKACDKH